MLPEVKGQRLLVSVAKNTGLELYLLDVKHQESCYNLTEGDLFISSLSSPHSDMWSTSAACSPDTSRSTTNPCSFTMSSCTASPTSSLKEVGGLVHVHNHTQTCTLFFNNFLKIVSQVVALFSKSTRPCSPCTHLGSSKSLNISQLKVTCFYKISGIASA